MKKTGLFGSVNGKTPLRPSELSKLCLEEISGSRSLGYVQPVLRQGSETLAGLNSLVPEAVAKLCETGEVGSRRMIESRPSIFGML